MKQAATSGRGTLLEDRPSELCPQIFATPHGVIKTRGTIAMGQESEMKNLPDPPQPEGS